MSWHDNQLSSITLAMSKSNTITNDKLWTCFSRRQPVHNLRFHFHKLILFCAHVVTTSVQFHFQSDKSLRSFTVLPLTRQFLLLLPPTCLINCGNWHSFLDSSHLLSYLLSQFLISLWSYTISGWHYYTWFWQLDNKATIHCVAITLNGWHMGCGWKNLTLNRQMIWWSKQFEKLISG